MSKVILKLGDDVSTDAIYPGRFMATVLPSETPQYIFADNAGFNAKAKNGEYEKGSVIAGQKNFGCGSSREQAASTIKGYDFTVIANDFARIFLQNAINLGLKCVQCPGFDASLDDEIVIENNKVVNKTSGKVFDIIPLPKARQSIIDAGGLVAYTRKRILEKTR